jgi:hypothetical protein
MREALRCTTVAGNANGAAQTADAIEDEEMADDAFRCPEEQLGAELANGLRTIGEKYFPGAASFNGASSSSSQHTQAYKQKEALFAKMLSYSEKNPDKDVSVGLSGLAHCSRSNSSASM